LGFSKQDRDTNVRRIGFITRLLSRNGVVAIAAVISPYRAVRDEVRQAHEAPFIEAFIDCPIDTLVQRDPKGLYARAMQGQLPDMSGISVPYEPPLAPDVHVKTGQQTVEESRAMIVHCLERRGLI